MTANEVDAFLNATHTAVLATVDRHGFPHCSGMWYVPCPGELRMWTYAKSQKVRNLERNDRCCVIVEAGHDYKELRGVTVRGRARITTDEEEIARIGIELYERYTHPETRVPLNDDAIVEIRRQAVKRVGVIVPTARVTSWDHSKL